MKDVTKNPCISSSFTLLRSSSTIGGWLDKSLAALALGFDLPPRTAVPLWLQALDNYLENINNRDERELNRNYVYMDYR